MMAFRVIGITGGVASGKSTVARLFADLGARLVDADRLAHEALAAPEIRERVRERWGAGVLGADGQVDRRALGRVVFAQAAELEALGHLVHPRVRELIAQEIETARRAGTPVVLDVALLLESGQDERCDVLVHVRASPEARERRAAERGWEPGEVERRERHQLEIERKAARADHQVDNDGTLEETRAQVARIWGEITESRERRS